MYSSKLMFHTVAGKTADWKINYALYAIWCARRAVTIRESSTLILLRPAPDVVFVQDAPDLATLEKQIHQITSNAAFQECTKKVSPLLRQSPNRKIYLVVDADAD